MRESVQMVCGLLGLIGFIVSLVCVAIVAGFTRSTHTVQYVPHDNTPSFEAEKDILAENEAALLNQVGKKKKIEKPTVVEDLDAPLEEITRTDLNF